MIPLVVLAAGRSTRMGRPKASLPLPGRHTFLSRIIHSAREAGVSQIFVVVGHEAEEVRGAAGAASEDSDVRFVENPRYDSGQLSSIVVGINAADAAGAPAVLLTLVDVPLVSAATIRAVIDRYDATHAPVVRPVDGDRHGHPVLIDRSLFDALRACDPQTGAKPVVRGHASAAGDVPVHDEGAFLDIDTRDEYARVLETLNGEA